jgi:chaperonin cofactor prefoldin
MDKTKKKTKVKITTTDKNRLKRALKEMEELSEEMNVLYNDIANCANKLGNINWYVQQTLESIEEDN